MAANYIKNRVYYVKAGRDGGGIPFTGRAQAEKFLSRNASAGPMLVFDSRAEFGRWCELNRLERVGEIADLRRQVPYEIIGPVTIAGKRYPAHHYTADFVYTRDGATVVEDVKSTYTRRARDWSLRAALMRERYGIVVSEYVTDAPEKVGKLAKNRAKTAPAKKRRQPAPPQAKRRIAK